MKRTHRGIRGHVLCVLLALLLAGCTWVIEPPNQAPPPPAPNAPTTSASYTSSEHLAAALAYAPGRAEHFYFTDWTELKRIAGVDVTSADSLEERLAFMRPLGLQEQAASTIYGLRTFQTHAEMWGWDSTDLLWEASFTMDGPPIWVLRFRDDFDFAPVLAFFNARDFVTGEHGGVTLFSHEMDLRAGWLTASEFAILNTAYMEESNTFVLSSAPDAVRATLDALAQGDTLAAQPAAQAVAVQLGTVGTAILESDACAVTDVAPPIGASPEAAAALQATLDEAGIRHAYDYFGFGYVAETGTGVGTRAVGAASIPLGVFVLHYANGAEAGADLAARRTVAVTGSSLANSAPYAELFEVIDAEVVPVDGGANLVLRLHALDRPPQLFINMIFRRDLLFAVCGG